MSEPTLTPAQALRTAAYVGDLTTVERLIAEGVDVNVWDQYGRTALSLAATAGHLEIVRHLVAAGAWIDPFDEDGVYMTPLMCAAERGQLAIAEFLLDRGANPTLRGGISICTAECFARTSHPYLAAILRHAEDRWRTASRGNTPKA